MRALGQDLIQNEAIAIAELVKNSYDADAEQVRIAFHGDFSKDGASITIEDDGCGMNAATIEGAWLEPATIAKIREPVSPKKGRAVTGEKGIGRFASGLVGQRLHIRSRPESNQTMVEATIDWGRFDDENLYLDEVKIEWEEKQSPADQGHGTKLTISSLNRKWTLAEFSELLTKLRTQLMRLISPFRKRSDFQIFIELPERYQEHHLFEGIEGEITPSPVFDYPIYRIEGSMNADGVVSGRVTVGSETRELKEAKGADLILKGAGNRTPRCGPFAFDFRVWERDAESISKVAELSETSNLNVRRDITAAQGISIYRDEFRIQMPDTDWLGLDLRRVLKPGSKLSTNQLVGALYVSKKGNRDIVDQTNRQALKDNDASSDLKECSIQLIEKIEQYRAKAKAEAQPVDLRGIFKKLEFTEVAAHISEKYADDKRLASLVQKYEKNLEQGTQQAQRVISRYRRLATLGQLFDQVIHDGRHPVGRLGNQLEKLRKMAASPQPISHRRLNEINTRIAGELELLQALFDRMAPLSGKRRGKPVRASLEEMIRDTVALLEGEMKTAGVEIDIVIPDNLSGAAATCHVGDVRGALQNLLHNAKYWSRTTNDRGQAQIQISLSRLGDSYQIRVADNGPGVHEDFRNSIWEPYVSTRRDGVGLGLAIVGEAMADQGGQALLLEESPLGGACFALQFGEDE